ncbi:hypothetical protein GGI07_002024 [Coemansia sp. Benny D115]|nr:hypothetical protein GGI07_002024 [Coemansia sp. Benny D115]
MPELGSPSRPRSDASVNWVPVRACLAAGPQPADKSNIDDSVGGRRSGALRRSVSKRLLGINGGGSSRSTIDLRQQQCLELDSSSGADNYSSVCHTDGEGEEASGNRSLLGRLHQTSRKTQKLDMTGPSGTKFAKKSAHYSEQSRYEAVGYPKSTRSAKSSKSSSSTSKEQAKDGGASQQQQQQQQQQTAGKLKGFQVRVINTHSGKTVVRAPILEGGPQAASERSTEDGPELPPLSAAELRYNAQRALITTTAVLRTAVGNKPGSRRGAAPKHQASVANLKAASPKSPPPVPQRRLTRTMSEKGPTLRTSPGSTAGNPIEDEDGFVSVGREHGSIDLGGDFHFDIDFVSRNSGSYTEIMTALRSPVRSKGFGALHLGLSPELEREREQGRASTGSMLDQWGISAAAAAAAEMHARQLELRRQQGGGGGGGYHGADEDSDSDGAAEDAMRIVAELARGGKASLEAMLPGVATSESPQSQGVLSDESQKLIDSVFSGRLSIGSGRSTTTTTTTTSRPAQPAAMPSSNSLSRQESTIKAKLKLSAGWSQHAQKATASEQPSAGERDGSKMRKPSFWSIFRGGSASQRKEQAEEKKDSAPAEISSSQSTGTKHHFLKKQQSSSSGFVDNIGFSKLLTLADSKYGTVAPSTNTFTNKALPSVPNLPPSPAIPQSTEQQQKQQQQQQQKQQQELHPQRQTNTSTREDTLLDTVAPQQMLSADNATLGTQIRQSSSEQPDEIAAEAVGAAATAGGISQCAPAPLVTMNSDFSVASVEGTVNESRISSGAFYTPTQEMFPLSVAGPSTGAADAKQSDLAEQPQRLIQGADSASGCTPDDSPVQVAGSLKCDSGAPPNDGQCVEGAVEGEDDGEGGVPLDSDDDNDSDIVPLSQSRVLAEAHARNAQHAQYQQLQQNLVAASIEAEAATGLRIVNGADKPLSLPAAIHAQGSGGVLGDDVDSPVVPTHEPLSATRMQFLPEISPKAGLAVSPKQQVTPVTAVAENVGAASQSDSSVQARAMGKYLYDIEEYQVRYYSQANRKAPAAETLVEPVKPEVLHGIEIPYLVEHAEWLGKREIFNGLVLSYYISNYDFAGLRIDECLRKLCSHIFLRGESQVIDRLLVALSRRYVECNPATKLKTADVAHAVTYSTLLLNTDLHIADIRASDRMSRNRFVRNTVDTIAQFQQNVTPSANGSNASGSSDAYARPEDSIAEGSAEIGVSMPPQLPELDLSKRSIDSAQMTGPADTPSSTVSSAQLPGSLDSYDMVSPATGPATAPVSSAEPQHSTLRSLMGSMASLNMGGGMGATHSNTTVARSSRDVVRLMGSRSKRFSFFESSSNSGNHGHAAGNGNGIGVGIGGAGNISAVPGAGAGISSAATAVGGPLGGASSSSSGIGSGLPTPTMGIASMNNAASSPSSMRAFDRLRRKVSTNGTHVRSRSGTLTIDESPLNVGGRPSLSGSQHSHQQRESDTLGSMVGRAISAAAGVASGNSAESGRAKTDAFASSTMPNLAELTTVLKDVYSGIKSKPLGQPLFARQATLQLEQQQQQQQQGHHHHQYVQNSSQYSMGHGLARTSHDQMLGEGGMRTSMAFGSGGKQSLDVSGGMYPRHPITAQGPHTAYGDHDPQGSSVQIGGGRPSSVRSMPMHSVQRTRSITSMNKAPTTGPGTTALRRPPHHPDLRVGIPFVSEGMKRSGSSLLNFGGGSSGNGMVRSSPSSASMGMGYLPSTAYTAYMRSPMENQHIRSGVLVRKHLFERAGKKASHRAWRTCYVSVDRGTVAMYKMDGRHGAHPDGRELTDTSLQLGSVSLRHTMTHMLPSPGYSRSRPHVFALQLPSGGVYLFQTASEVELRDWVAACNYWAARESKAPYMIGGVYNMEYGWDNTGDFALRFDEREAREDRGEVLSAAEMAAEERRVMEEREASRGASILEWSPPNNPMQRSDLDETAQLKALLHHISYLEEELVSHKKVQGSIDERFFPKTQLHHRAFSNWERKAQYILQELIKYQSYADVLQKALKQMEEMTPTIPEETATMAAGVSSSAAAAATMAQHHEGSAGAGACAGASGGSGAGAGGPAMGGFRMRRGDASASASGMDEDTSIDESMHRSSSHHQLHQPHGQNIRVSSTSGLSASRASLPQAGGTVGSGRRTTDSNGNPTSSKSLPIKELLAPASEKARNRASIIVPTSASSAATAVAQQGGGVLLDERRRGSHSHIARASSDAMAAAASSAASSPNTHAASVA